MSVYRIYTANAVAWTGHLHTVSTRAAAERWVEESTRQGYTALRIVESKEV